MSRSHHIMFPHLTTAFLHPILTFSSSETAK